MACRLAEPLPQTAATMLVSRGQRYSVWPPLQPPHQTAGHSAGARVQVPGCRSASPGLVRGR
jgi:hypothetical protein